MTKFYDGTKEVERIKKYIEEMNLISCGDCKELLSDLELNSDEIMKRKCKFCIFYFAEILENYDIIVG